MIAAQVVSVTCNKTDAFDREFAALLNSSNIILAKNGGRAVDGDHFVVMYRERGKGMSYYADVAMAAVVVCSNCGICRWLGRICCCS